MTDPDRNEYKLYAKYKPRLKCINTSVHATDQPRPKFINKEYSLERQTKT